MTKHGLRVDYLREMFSATYKSILSVPREKSDGAKSFILLMAPDRSFWCYHREECSRCSGICKLPPLWDLSTNFAPHSGTTFPLYFMETISTPFPSSQSRITWASISLFTNLLGPYNTIKPNYPKNSFPLSPSLSNALDMCTSKDSANVTCHLPATSILFFCGGITLPVEASKFINRNRQRMCLMANTKINKRGYWIQNEWQGMKMHFQLNMHLIVYVPNISCH